MVSYIMAVNFFYVLVCDGFLEFGLSDVIYNTRKVLEMFPETELTL